MRIAIMQPTYLPWLGYFNLVANADVFVFLDDVQFDHRSWQHRNRIIAQETMTWLTVPVFTRGRTGQPIFAVEVVDSVNWRQKHVSAIRNAYARAPWSKEVSEIVNSVISSADSRLCEINISLVTSLARYIGLSTTFLRSSEIDNVDGRSQKLLSICKSLGGSIYLGAAGSKEYIIEDGVFADEQFPVYFQNFSPTVYRDNKNLIAGDFPSIVDALAWIGPSATRDLVTREII